MPVFAALGAVSALAGIASTVKSFSAQSASADDVARANEAASTANIQVGKINEQLRDEISQQNEIIKEDVRSRNEIIRSTNQELRAINRENLDLNEQINQNISGVNVERNLQIGLSNQSAEITSAQSAKQAVREAAILRGRTINIAGTTGVAIESSGVQGGLSSLDSQLADTLGIASQQTSISRKAFQSSVKEQDLNSENQSLAVNIQNLNIKGIEEQRKAETNLTLQQNRANLALSKSNRDISLLQNEADRIKEQASLDPKQFNFENSNSRETVLAIAKRSVNPIKVNDGIITTLPSGTVQKVLDDGGLIRFKENGDRVFINDFGTRRVFKPDGRVITTEVDPIRIKKFVATTIPTPPVGETGGAGD